MSKAIDWVGVLALISAILNSGIVILSFAFLVYILLYNLRSNVARIFAGRRASVLVVYFVDLAVIGAPLDVALIWLRIQWVGIAFTPAVYLHFSDALLQTTNDRSPLRTTAIRVAYVLGGGILLIVAFTDLLVWDGVQQVGAVHLRAGPLFWGFFLYFLLAVGWGGVNVLRAWLRCLTSTSRRRMAYLAASFAAPAAGVFPYLLVTGWPERLPGILFWLLLAVGNMAVGLMLVVLAYTVAFFGALTPDRVVKHRFIRFLLRGPLQATAVVIVVVAATRTDGLFGLPPTRLALFGVVLAILLIQVGIELSKPVIDRALYRQDRQEIAWLQGLGDRLLTTNDLRQFLENVLTALCDLLRTDTAFIATLEGGEARLEVTCGYLELAEIPLPAGLDGIAGETPPPDLHLHAPFFIWDGYWLLPLRPRSGDVVIGVLGMSARSPEPDLSPEEEMTLQMLTSQIEAALEDRLIQRALFGALERVIPQIEEIQRRRGIFRYEGPAAMAGLTGSLPDDEFQKLVRGALSHYWGGPKLTSSPLLNLRIVERAREEHGSSPVNALRAVLQAAIERLRPEGDRSMTASEWLLYNKLELKFLKRYRVRDVAMRLAMSESDLYRKQRVAIEQVARVLAEMEREAQGGSIGSKPGDAD